MWKRIPNSRSRKSEGTLTKGFGSDTNQITNSEIMAIILKTRNAFNATMCVAGISHSISQDKPTDGSVCVTNGMFEFMCFLFDVHWNVLVQVTFIFGDPLPERLVLVVKCIPALLLFSTHNLVP